ncbi:hypothetical protein DL96DRAFT_1688216 [Flagelloscypha sp. PMI_526]|nr:hypothetical protein DL96DRAFT_1688216 [Flagelloscypha sp. PMI_526]
MKNCFPALALFVTSALAVFISPAEISSTKKYQLRDATNNAFVLAQGDGNILSVVDTGDEVVIASTGVDPAQIFTFPSGAPPTSFTRGTDTPALTTADLSPGSNLAELLGGPNIRLRGPFTTAGSPDELALATVQSTDGLGVVFQAPDGSYVGVQEPVGTGTPAVKVNGEYVWKLFEVPTDGEADQPV